MRCDCLLTKSALVSIATLWGLGAQEAYAGPVQIVPYASVSSTKSIKPNKVGKKESTTTPTEETVAQRTTYGLRINVRLSRLFNLQLQGGTNKLDQTRKASAMRDEYGDIDFAKDANVDTSAQDATYTYSEEQRVGQAMLSIQPSLGKILKVKMGAGVRARERFVNVTDKSKDLKTSIHDPIRYNAVASVGAQLRVFRAFSAMTEYNFYFLKFPKTEPHEQEVLMGFGFQL